MCFPFPALIDPNAKATDPPPSETILGAEETETDLVTWRKMVRPGSGSAPLLTETSQMPAGRVWQLPVDSTLRLKCVAQGEPEPHLIWLKVKKKLVFHRDVAQGSFVPDREAICLYRYNCIFITVGKKGNRSFPKVDGHTLHNQFPCRAAKGQTIK